MNGCCVRGDVDGHRLAEKRPESLLEGSSIAVNNHSIGEAIAPAVHIILRDFSVLFKLMYGYLMSALSVYIVLKRQVYI
jgi:hypothetical protein